MCIYEKKFNKLTDSYEPKVVFKCKCGATVIEAQNNELKKAAIHMQCRICNCFLERVSE